MPVRGRHWLWENRQPEPLIRGSGCCRHALFINVKPITAQEKLYFPRANTSLARAQALLWVRDWPFHKRDHSAFWDRLEGQNVWWHVAASTIKYQLFIDNQN